MVRFVGVARAIVPLPVIATQNDKETQSFAAMVNLAAATTLN
ncbi:MAG: hypothetical protein ACREDT_02335 [Methylocella sp.]